jgi:hypothetical protein
VPVAAELGSRSPDPGLATVEATAARVDDRLAPEGSELQAERPSLGNAPLELTLDRSSALGVAPATPKSQNEVVIPITLPRRGTAEVVVRIVFSSGE